MSLNDNYSEVDIIGNLLLIYFLKGSKIFNEVEVQKREGFRNG